MKEITIDGNNIHTKEELHATFAEELGFPEWYGGNLDALHDCLTDIREHVMLRIVNYDALAEHLPMYARMTVWAIRHSCEDNPRLHLTVDREVPEEDEE